MKTIDLNQSVYSLCKEFPELIEVLADLGFKDITKPGMLGSVGRIMTITKGASMKNIDLDLIKKKLEEQGFSVK